MTRGAISNLNAIHGCSDVDSCLQAEGHSSEESTNHTCVQESKSSEPFPIQERNNTTRELSDLSASSKRRRSPHSSRGPKSLIPKAKGGSERDTTREQGSRSKVSNLNLRMFVNSKLSVYRDRNCKYNGIVRILADAGFLQYCYMLIKGKKGNMSPGTTKETLDGLTYD